MKQARFFLYIVYLGVAVLLVSACGGGSGPGTVDDGNGVGNGGGSNPVAATSFEIVELPDLGGGFSASIAVNNAAAPEVIGFSADHLQTVKAVSWILDNGAAALLSELAPLPGNHYSAAYGINASGFAVGESGAIVVIDNTPISDRRSVAVLWQPGNPEPTALSLAGLFENGDSAAYAINSQGQIVGESARNPGGDTVAVFWPEPGADPVILADLSTSAGVSTAFFIHDSGLIAGESLNGDGRMQAVVWKPASGGAYDPPIPMTPFIDQTASTAFGIDSADRVVGQVEWADGERRGVIWNTSGALLADLGPGTAATGINQTNRISGLAEDDAGVDQAAVWNAANPEDHQIIDAAFSQAYGINDDTHVVGMYEGRATVAVPR